MLSRPSGTRHLRPSPCGAAKACHPDAGATWDNINTGLNKRPFAAERKAENPLPFHHHIPYASPTWVL
jgi:hypothetical protein